MSNHTPESIRELLATSDAAVERALIVLYERQTMDEQMCQTTSHRNGMGFNALDAEILSSFAVQVQEKLVFDKWTNAPGKLGKCLSPKQRILARKKVARYAKQLAEVANAKAAAAAPKKVEEPATVEPKVVWMEPPANLEVEEPATTLADIAAKLGAWVNQ